MVSLTVPSPPTAQTRSNPASTASRGEALGVAVFGGLHLLHDVPEAAKRVEDERHVALVPPAAGVRVEDGREALAGDRHASTSGTPDAMERSSV